MDEAIKELVTVLRRAGYDKSADALEAMAGEVARHQRSYEIIKEERDQYLEFWKCNSEACAAAEAERDRLAGDLKDRTVQLVDAIFNAKEAHAKAQTRGDEVASLTAERDRLKAALETIAYDNVPREVFIVWRTDGSNSKHDKCQHMRVMHDDCGNCTALFAREALGGAS